MPGGERDPHVGGYSPANSNLRAGYRDRRQQWRRQPRLSAWCLMAAVLRVPAPGKAAGLCLSSARGSWRPSSVSWCSRGCGRTGRNRLQFPARRRCRPRFYVGREAGLRPLAVSLARAHSGGDSQRVQRVERHTAATLNNSEARLGISVSACSGGTFEGRIVGGDGRIRTADGGFADPCLNHLATSPRSSGRIGAEEGI